MICLELCWEIFEMDLSRLFVLFNVEETCKPQNHEMKVQKQLHRHFSSSRFSFTVFFFCNYVYALHKDKQQLRLGTEFLEINENKPIFIYFEGLQLWGFLFFSKEKKV